MQDLETELKKLHKLSNLDAYAFSNRDINDTNEWHFRKGAEWGCQKALEESPNEEEIEKVFKQIIDRDIVHLDEFVKAIRGLFPNPKDNTSEQGCPFDEPLNYIK